MAEKKKPVVKPEKPVTIAIGVPGRKAHIAHKVSKNKKGDVVVEHTNSNQGKYDKINLTKKAGVSNVKQGVKAVQDWHKSNPHRKQGR
jgi:hypothetical protein